MRPVAQFEVDLDGDPVDLVADVDADEAEVLCWASGRPIGVLRLALVGGRLSRHVVAAAASLSLAASRRRAVASSSAPAPGVLPSLTVAVCTHERPDMLAECLQAIRRSVGSEPVEVLVVDNAPTSERTREVVAASGVGVRYVREDAQGLDVARNRALRECSTDLIAFVDDDVVVSPSWCRAVRDAFAREDRAMAMTGAVVAHSLRRPAEILFERHGGFGRGFDPVRRSARTVQQRWWLHAAGNCGAGCNMAFRRAFLVDLGGFDESLDVGRRLPGGGDLDIFSRTLRSGGLMLYVPEALVRHRHRPEMGALRSQFYNWGRGLTAALTATFIDEPGSRVGVLRVLAWWLLSYIPRALLTSRRRGSRPGFVVMELLGGLVGPFSLLSTRRYVRRVRAARARREADASGVTA